MKQPITDAKSTQKLLCSKAPKKSSILDATLLFISIQYKLWRIFA